jgi:hypothetical protein
MLSIGGKTKLLKEKPFYYLFHVYGIFPTIHDYMIEFPVILYARVNSIDNIEWGLSKNTS